VDGNLGLWKSYRLNVADPDRFDRFYAVIVSSWFGRTYRHEFRLSAGN